MILVVESARAEAISALLADLGETVIPLGQIVAGEGVIYQGKLL